MNIFNFFLFFLGTSGLKAEAKVLARDQRYASNAARDLSQNFTRSLAPTDYFDRIYASLCVQMTDLQHRLYEVESVVNPAAYRAAVADTSPFSFGAPFKQEEINHSTLQPVLPTPPPALKEVVRPRRKTTEMRECLLRHQHQQKQQINIFPLPSFEYFSHTVQY